MKPTSQSIFGIFAIAALFLIQGCAATPGLSTFSSGRPPLHEAALVSNVEKMKGLLQRGANPNEHDDGGFTPMHWASASSLGRNKEMLQLLVKHGGNPNVLHSTTDMVPLQFAHNLEAVEALIDLGAKLDTKDIAKATPLHSAKKPDLAKAMLKAGANPNLKNGVGHTPVEGLKALLPYYTGDGVMATLRKQIQDTIDVIENFDHKASTNTAHTSSDHPQDEFLMVVEGNTSPTSNDDIPTHYTDSKYKPSRANVSPDSEINTYTGMTFHENTRQTSVDISLGTTPALTSGTSAMNDVPPMPAYYASDNTSNQPSNETVVNDFSEEGEIDFDAAEKEAEKLEAAQACPMQEYDWYYTGKDCKDELAHGKGKAINPFEGMYFEGMIEAGQPAEGTLYRNNKEVFEGAFKNGKPNGEGICFYQGEPEECKYYKGKRIDSLHKQRQEFERQRKLMRSAQ